MKPMIDAIMNISSVLVSNAEELWYKMQIEILVFAIAIGFNAIVFGGLRVGKKKKKGLSKLQSDGPPGVFTTSNVVPILSPRTAALKYAVEKKMNAGSSPEDMASEIQTQLVAIKSKNEVVSLSDMLEAIGSATSADVIASVRIVLRQRGLLFDARLSELLLRGYFALGSNEDFNEALQEVEAAARERGAPVAPGVQVLAMKVAVRMCDMDQALAIFRGLAGSWQQIQSPFTNRGLQKLVHLASQKDALPRFVEMSSQAGLVGEALNAVVIELAQAGPASICREAEKLANESSGALSQAAIAALVSGFGTVEDAERLFKRVLKSSKAEPETVVAVLRIASVLRDAGGDALAEFVLREMSGNPTPAIATAIICFSAGATAGDTPNPDEDLDQTDLSKMGLSMEASTAVIDVYEKHFASVSLSRDAIAERFVVDAALRCKRTSTVRKVVGAMGDSNRQQALIKFLGGASRLQDAFAVFYACPEQNAFLYNALLDACAECKDAKAAERVVSEACTSGKADAFTYNTLLRAYARANNAEMSCVNLPQDVWSVVGKMLANGFRANHSSCFTLLKSLQHHARPVHIERTMSLIDNMEGEIDDALLSSILAACMRVGRADLLRRWLQRQQSSQQVPVWNTYTFGNIIRAHAYLKDFEAVWDTWREMWERKIPLSSVTLGCMVEALVSNGDPAAAYQLIREVKGDEESKGVLNGVIYGTVLKGFAHQKSFSCAWSVYQEMCADNMDFTIVTFNTLLDACARCGEVGRAPLILTEMEKHNVEPNLISYSAILKGYCKDGKTDQAFELLARMRETTKFKPDEIMFNSLLDGCACEDRWERGIALLEEMEQVGIKPSNFTLTLVVKLASRCRRINAAFDLTNAIATTYGFKLNVHVFRNLICACFHAKDLPRAVGVLERMLREGVRPDLQTYKTLIQWLLGAGEHREAANVLRAALGRPEAHERLADVSSSITIPEGGVPNAVISEVLESLMSSGGQAEIVVVGLLQDLKRLGRPIDPKVQMKLAARASHGQ